MSKFMQIDIRIEPIYKPNFHKLFPKIERLLRNYGYGKEFKKEPTFYKLVDTFNSIMRNSEVPEDDKGKLLPFYVKFNELKEKAREYLLARKISKLDKALYELEDTFQDLEKELSCW